MQDGYIRKALVRRVVDADTIELEIDLGFDVWTVQKIRLVDVDAWEKRGEERLLGIKAAMAVNEKLPIGGSCYVQTFKSAKGKFGRYLARIFYPEVAGGSAGEGYEYEYKDLGAYLLEEGHAVPYGDK